MVSTQRRIAKAAYDVIVDQADRLHEGVTDSGSDEVESALLEGLAYGVGFRSACRNLLHRLGRVDSRLAADELPDPGVEAAEFFLYLQKCLGIAYRRRNFEFVADDAGIAQQTLDLAAVVARDARGIESVEGFAVVLALVQNRVPAQASLRAFKDEEFKERAVVVRRHAPFFIVIPNRKFVAGPGAANRLRRVFHHRRIFRHGRILHYGDPRVSQRTTLSKGHGCESTPVILGLTCFPATWC